MGRGKRNHKRDFTLKEARGTRSADLSEIRDGNGSRRHERVGELIGDHETGRDFPSAGNDGISQGARSERVEREDA